MLFERRGRSRVYATMRAELDAVRDGRKAIAMELWPRDSIAEDRDYSRLVRLALARGLQLVHQPDRSRDGLPIVAVYALRTEQAWRIPALHALWRVVAATAAWGDAAEAVEGFLLGYSEPQIAAWLAERRRERLGWRGTTIYLVITPSQRERLATTGCRYLDPEMLAAGISAAACDATRVIKVPPPSWIARRKLALARVALADPAVSRILGPPAALRTARLGAGHATVLNRALESHIEILDRGGWR